MNEHTTTEQFSRDLDRFLRHSAIDGIDDWPESYRREMEVVRALAEADFSTESRVRTSLKRRLLGAQPGRGEKLSIFTTLRGINLRVGLAVLFTLLLILTASPLGSTLAQTVVQIVQTWTLGEHTRAVSVDGDFEAVVDERGDTVVLPAGESAAGQIEATTESETGTHANLEARLSIGSAQELVEFRLKEPAFVPEGYEFQGASVMHSGQASLDYFNTSENKLLGLLQTAVGGANGEVQVTFSGDISAQDVLVNGYEGLWTQAGEEGLLVWEAGGVNYQLMGLGDLDLALQVAESLQ